MWLASESLKTYCVLVVLVRVPLGYKQSRKWTRILNKDWNIVLIYFYSLQEERTWQKLRSNWAAKNLFLFVTLSLFDHRECSSALSLLPSWCPLPILWYRCPEFSLRNCPSPILVPAAWLNIPHSTLQKGTSDRVLANYYILAPGPEYSVQGEPWNLTCATEKKYVLFSGFFNLTWWKPRMLGPQWRKRRNQ